jgi:RTX calcium-binding nonapeptide repeat (4 copies)
MARLVNMDSSQGIYIEPDGTGPIGWLNPQTRQSFLQSVATEISVNSSEVMLRSVAADGWIKFSGSFSYDGSGLLSGLSGTISAETLGISFSNEAPRYVLSELNLSIYDYLNVATWESIFSGNDMIIASDSTEHGDVIEAGFGFDTVYGGKGNDYIQGGFNGDRLYGEEGNDDLRGGNGLDLIVGGVGNDTIRGAKGTDTLTGGEGADVFIFHTDLDGTINVDTITDFVSGVDRIELSSAIFGNAGAVGANVGLSQYITYNAATGVLSYDQDGAGSGAAKAFAVLGTDSHPAIGTDFWVVT